MTKTPPHSGHGSRGKDDYILTREQRVIHADFIRARRIEMNLTEAEVVLRWEALPDKLVKPMGKSTYCRFEKGQSAHFCLCTVIDLARVFRTNVFDILPPTSPLIDVFAQNLAPGNKHLVRQQLRNDLALLSKEVSGARLLAEIAELVAVIAEDAETRAAA